METRSIAIGLVAIVAAFAAAFGIAKSGGSKTETAGAGVKAQSIKVAAPAAVTGVQVGGTLPALKAERKAPAKKKKKAASTTNSSAPSASSTVAPQATTQAPQPQPTAQAPQPQPKSPPSDPGPKVPDTRQPPPQSGGEDG
jgi:hypothetical protein